MKHEKRRYFITGLLIVLPVLITVYLFVTLFTFFDNILGRYLSRYTIDYFGFKIPGLGLLVFFILIFVTGFFATHFIGRRLFLYFEHLWLKFPVVRNIYPAAKQIIRFLFAPRPPGVFEKVVLVEYPRKGIYSVGFVTNQSDGIIRQKVGGKELFNIFIPSVPSPLTGFLILVPREELIFLDMGIEEAMKIYVSGGVLNPRDVI